MDINDYWFLAVEVELDMTKGVTSHKQNSQLRRVMKRQSRYLMIRDPFQKLLAILKDVMLTNKINTSRMCAPAR